MVLLLLLRGSGRQAPAKTESGIEAEEDMRLRLLRIAGTLLEKATLPVDVDDSRRESERAEVILEATAGGEGLVVDVFFLI